MSKLKEWFRKNQMVFVIAIIFATVIKLVMVVGEYTETSQVEWKKSACPALLSITRSARDTLIVMKSEFRCNQYVMENLR